MGDIIINVLGWLLGILLIAGGIQMVYLYNKKYVKVKLIGEPEKFYSISGHRMVNLSYSFGEKTYKTTKALGLIFQNSVYQLKVNPNKPKSNLNKYEAGLGVLLVVMGFMFFLALIGLI